MKKLEDAILLLQDQDFFLKTKVKTKTLEFKDKAKA